MGKVVVCIFICSILLSAVIVIVQGLSPAKDSIETSRDWKPLEWLPIDDEFTLQLKELKQKCTLMKEERESEISTLKKLQEEERSKSHSELMLAVTQKFEEESKKVTKVVKKLLSNLGLVELGDAEYYYFSNAKQVLTWSDSLNFCQSRGLQLVSIEDKPESDQILDHITSTLGLKNYKFWIGGTDAGHEGRWKWISTGQPFTFTLWDKSEPSNKNGNEHCAELTFPTNRQVNTKEPQFPSWNDENCGQKRRFICGL